MIDMAINGLCRSARLKPRPDWLPVSVKAEIDGAFRRVIGYRISRVREFRGYPLLFISMI
jgi:hypothetical protein